MRLFSLLRSPVRAGGIALLWLLAASTASAAAAPEYVRDKTLCDGQQTTTVRKLLRHPKSYGGPLAARARGSQPGPRFDLSAHVRRAKRTSLGNGAAAIANDAPAARDDSNDDSLTSLRPLGFLIGPVDSHPRTRAFSPRSPRGPPASV